jgi:hypothetical protein
MDGRKEDAFNNLENVYNKKSIPVNIHIRQMSNDSFKNCQVGSNRKVNFVISWTFIIEICLKINLLTFVLNKPLNIFLNFIKQMGLTQT